mmetsp:Transcript_27668/g.42572  ORF Transcript_27668/g.42572 Transcript_27668/m.42572 type:complete len:434 (+) Transcript_27668:658-1959(+)
MGRTVFTNSDRVVGKDPRDTVEFGKSSNTDGWAEVVNENSEGRSRSLEESVVAESVKDGSHSVFADSEVKVLSSVGLVQSRSEVSSVVDVVTGRSVEISRSRDVVWNNLGDFVDGLHSRNTGSFRGGVHLWDSLDHFFGGHDIVFDGIGELLGEFWVGFGPGCVGLLPFVVGFNVLCLDIGEVVAGSFGYVPFFSFWDSHADLCLVNVWDTGFSVSSVGSLGFFHSLSDNGVALDELWLSVVVGLGSRDGSLDCFEVVSINVEGFPSVSFVTSNDVFGLSVFSHLVEGDFVSIVKNDEVVKLLVSSEASGFSGDSLLEASISSKGEDVVVEDGVVFGVVNSFSHLFGGSETNSVGNTLTKRSGGTFNSWGVVFGVWEFRMSWSHGVVLTEVLEFFDWEIEPSQVEPRVKEHGSVSSRKDEAVTVHPLWIVGVV